MEVLMSCRLRKRRWGCLQDDVRFALSGEKLGLSIGTKSWISVAPTSCWKDERAMSGINFVWEKMAPCECINQESMRQS